MKPCGLSDEQVRESFEKFGDNSLAEQSTSSFWKKFRDNFGDPMIRILVVALAINVVLAFFGEVAWYESAGIALAVFLAVFVSTLSEYRNENVFRRLQEEASRIVCKVFRNGEICEIAVGDIVVGDAVLLQAGDLVPADGIVAEGSIGVDQSVLNGETQEASKSAAPDNHVDDTSGVDFLDPYRVFRGAVVVSGNAVMAVTTVGDGSVYGQIASELADDTERDSPLKVKLTGLARGISRFGYFGGVAIALALLFQRVVVMNDFDWAVVVDYCSSWTTVLRDLVDAVMIAVIIIVMAVPEGLPLMIAIVSALNMGKMLKDNVLVRKVSGIETAGSLNILFSDKTGTITHGRLETVVFVDGTGTQYRSCDEVAAELRLLLRLSVERNTMAIVNRSGSTVGVIGGNATERAIMQYAITDDDLDVDVVEVSTIPFSSENKYSATTVRGEYNLTLIKGAPERILGNSQHYYDQDGVRQPLDDERKRLLEEKIDALAARAIRVVALVTSEQEINGTELPEGDWTLVGAVGIRDEVRPESVGAIREVKNAGVQVVMITGDRKDTAVAIATDAGLVEGESDLVITSEELSRLSDDEIRSCLGHLRVVARALPSDKSRLVRIAKEMNLVVGMTGDGVNDSPALKAADVGFAMGGGTEVAKEAGDIVILDDNFSSIDKAILYGRTIFSSIRKFIVFQLTINVSAVLVSFVMPLTGHGTPLSITQILWINLVMDTLAALAFGGEPALRRYMSEAPKRRDEPIVSPSMRSAILTGAVWTFALSLVFLLTGLVTPQVRDDPADRYLLTGYFAFFVFTAVFNAFNARTEKLNLVDSIGKNPGFLRVLGIVVAVQLVLVYAGGEVLRSYGLTVPELLGVLGLAFLIIPVDLCRKLLLARRARSHQTEQMPDHQMPDHQMADQAA